MSTERGGRDLAIDALRGTCIVMMVAAHLSKASAFDRITHPVLWIDGASGFVLLSGLLVGVVQRSTMRRDGERAGYRKLLRRVRLVYLGHLFICVVALAVTAVDASRAGALPSAAAEGGWVLALLRAATLQINPPYASVLSLYVVLMLAAVPLLWLLHRDRWWAAGGCVLVVYAMGLLRPEWSQLPQRAGVVGGWSCAAWFGLFATGVAAGWIWRRTEVQQLVRSRAALLGGLLLAVLGAGVAAAVAGAGLGRLLDKEVFGPGRLVLAVVVFFALWRVVGLLLGHRVAATALHPLTVVGQRSLDSYVLLSTLVLVTPSLGLTDQGGAAGMTTAAATVLACVAWAYARRAGTRWVAGRRHSAQGADPGEPLPASAAAPPGR